MGNRSRIAKGMQQGVAIADTRMVVGDCVVLVGHPDPVRAKSVAREFALMMAKTLNRAKCVNMSDIYNKSLDVRKQIEAGELVFN